MFPLRNIITRNIIRMGKPIKRTPAVQANSQFPKKIRSLDYSTSAIQENVPAVKLPQAMVGEMRFQDLSDVLHPTLLATIQEDLKFDKMMPVCIYFPSSLLLLTLQ